MVVKIFQAEGTVFVNAQGYKKKDSGNWFNPLSSMIIFWTLCPCARHFWTQANDLLTLSAIDSSHLSDDCTLELKLLRTVKPLQVLFPICFLFTFVFLFPPTLFNHTYFPCSLMSLWPFNSHYLRWQSSLLLSSIAFTSKVRVNEWPPDFGN